MSNMNMNDVCVGNCNRASQSQDIEFEEDRAWHQVKEDTLYIGGMLTRLNDAGKRIGYEYSCTIRNKSIVHTAVN